MNERQARDKGYIFTGAYKRSREELAPRVAELKTAGYKAVIVTVPDSPLSRGGVGTGYSIYAEQRYFKDLEREEVLRRLRAIPARTRRAMEEYKKDITEIGEEEARLKARLKELE